MNNKGQIVLGVTIFLIILAIIVAVYLITPLFFNDGTSTDYAYNVEKTKIGWYKLWLKDDHTTVYCFDDERFIEIIEKAKAEDKKINVKYQDYWFRGFFCNSGSDNIGTTVVTDITILN